MIGNLKLDSKDLPDFKMIVFDVFFSKRYSRVKMVTTEFYALGWIFSTGYRLEKLELCQKRLFDSRR